MSEGGEGGEKRYEATERGIGTSGVDAMTERRRIHFLTDVEELGVGWKCLRCGYAAFSKEEMYDHRKGFISHCLRERVFWKIRDFIVEDET